MAAHANRRSVVRVVAPAQSRSEVPRSGAANFYRPKPNRLTTLVSLRLAIWATYGGDRDKPRRLRKRRFGRRRSGLFLHGLIARFRSAQAPSRPRITPRLTPTSFEYRAFERDGLDMCGSCVETSQVALRSLRRSHCEWCIGRYQPHEATTPDGPPTRATSHCRAALKAPADACLF